MPDHDDMQRTLARIRDKWTADVWHGNQRRTGIVNRDIADLLGIIEALMVPVKVVSSGSKGPEY